jgi:DDE superfamily endonuclease
MNCQTKRCVTPVYITSSLLEQSNSISHQITWDTATANDPNTSLYVGSIDGTHCPIEEPRQRPDWYSHKIHRSALTYQIVASIQESKILSIKGPYPAGMPDISVFKLRDGVLSLIPANKRLIDDKGY